MKEIFYKNVFLNKVNVIRELGISYIVLTVGMTTLKVEHHHWTQA